MPEEMFLDETQDDLTFESITISEASKLNETLKRIAKLKDMVIDSIQIRPFQAVNQGIIKQMYEIKYRTHGTEEH